MTGPVVVAWGAGWLLLFLVLAASIVTSLVILVEQELRNRRAPILALSCEIRRVDASAPRAADAPVGPLSVSVTNGGPTPVRAVLIAIEVLAPDGRVGSYSDIRIARLGAGTTQSAVSVDGNLPPLAGAAAVELRYTITATDVNRRRWFRTFDDEVSRFHRT